MKLLPSIESDAIGPLMPLGAPTLYRKKNTLLLTHGPSDLSKNAEKHERIAKENMNVL